MVVIAQELEAKESLAEHKNLYNATLDLAVVLQKLPPARGEEEAARREALMEANATLIDLLQMSPQEFEQLLLKNREPTHFSRQKRNFSSRRIPRSKRKMRMTVTVARGRHKNDKLGNSCPSREKLTGSVRSAYRVNAAHVLGPAPRKQLPTEEAPFYAAPIRQTVAHTSRMVPACEHLPQMLGEPPHDESRAFKDWTKKRSSF